MPKNYTPPPDDEPEDNNEERHYEADFESIQSELKKVDTVPELDPKAYYGIAGEIALKVGEKTEADSRGVLVSFLVGVGNLLGRNAAFRVNDTLHYPNEFVVLVGATAVARKGMTVNIVERILRTVDSEWVDGCIAYGFSSGEGLVHYVRDPRYEEVNVAKKGEEPKFETKLKDKGVGDKRCLCVTGEFGEPLVMMMREGNILGSVLRNAWDGRHKLEINTRQVPICATGAHISMLGCITRDELLKLLPQIPNSDGFANRFLWCMIDRSKLLPSGGPPVEQYLSKVLERLHKIMKKARGLCELCRSEAAEDVWTELYSK